MTVIRRQRRDNFAIVPNEIADDERLSFEARGLLIYLLAKPNDWSVQVADIQRRGGIGRNKAYNLISTLIAAGYVERVRERDASGRLGASDYVVYDVPILTSLPLADLSETDALEPDAENGDMDAPSPDIGDMEEPRPENPDVAKQDLENGDALLSTQETNIPLNPPEDDDGFGKLASKWPEKVRGDVDRAHGAFLRLDAKAQHHAVIAADSYLTATRLKHTPPRFASLRTYLGQRLFEEFIDAPEIEFSGRFRITPKRPEWPHWLKWAETLGPKSRASLEATGFILTETRYPPTEKK